MNDFKDIQTWQKSIDFATKIYTATDTFPENEKFGLVAPLRRRATVVLPSKNTRRNKGSFINRLTETVPNFLKS